jgi:hypothetical protein
VRKNKLAVISVCLLSACLAQAQDASSDPDYIKENRFHNIYKKYNEQPTSVESWEKALGMRRAETYRVQKGDTLWDISSTLFGDSQFWPKVWSLNKGSILNPHEINPAMAIQFFAGDMQDAPTLELASADTVQKDEKTVVVDTGDGNKEVVAMPPARRTTPVLKHLPNSIPQYAATIVQKDPKVQMDLRPNAFPAGPEYLGYYLTDTPVEGSGKITGTEIDGKTAAEFQYVYVTMMGTPEKHYVVEKNVGKVPDPAHKNRFGQMVEYQAEIEIMERVNSDKNIYRAFVTKTITPLEVGAVVVPGRLPIIDPAATPVTSGVGGKIIGGQYEKSRALFGSTALIFLDAGSQQGLQLGQSMNIIADEKLRNTKTPVQVNERVIGTAKIVRLSPGFATAYVTRSTNDIMPGDFVGTTQAHASAGPVDSFDSKSNGGDSDLEKEFDSMPDEPAAPSDSGSDEGELEL